MKSVKDFENEKGEKKEEKKDEKKSFYNTKGKSLFFTIKESETKGKVNLFGNKMMIKKFQKSYMENFETNPQKSLESLKNAAELGCLLSQTILVDVYKREFDCSYFDNESKEFFFLKTPFKRLFNNPDTDEIEKYSKMCLNSGDAGPMEELWGIYSGEKYLANDVEWQPQINISKGIDCLKEILLSPNILTKDQNDKIIKNKKEFLEKEKIELTEEEFFKEISKDIAEEKFEKFCKGIDKIKEIHFSCGSLQYRTSLRDSITSEDVKNAKINSIKALIEIDGRVLTKKQREKISSVLKELYNNSSIAKNVIDDEAAKQAVCIWKEEALSCKDEMRSLDLVKQIKICFEEGDDNVYFGGGKLSLKIKNGHEECIIALIEIAEKGNSIKVKDAAKLALEDICNTSQAATRMRDDFVENSKKEKVMHNKI